MIEAVADNTIRFQPEEVLAFGCDVSRLSERQSRPALGGWLLVSPISGAAASTMESDRRRKMTPALSPAPGLLRRMEYESSELIFAVLFEMGFYRLFSMSPAVNYVAPSHVRMVCSLLVTSGFVMLSRFPVVASGMRQMF